MELFIEITLLVVIASAIAAVMRFLKQPLIVGYILAGILAGPYVFDILHSTDQVELFSKIGITILLFIVGLHLSPVVIHEVGKVSLITGVGQVLFTSLIGFVIAIFLGFDHISALYISIALTFSSTIIILKLLSDRGDLNKLYGKIAIGFLLVQDIIATIILLFISAYSNSGDANLILVSSFLLVKLLIILLSLYLINIYFVPYLLRFASKSQELLFLFSLAWGMGLASLLYLVGFSVEIGALIAGVMLSMSPYAFEIGSRLKPLRDFFIVVFFVLLGSQMILDQVGSLIIPAIIFSVFVLIGNPVIVVIIMNLLGFKRKTGFMAGLTVAQISEFSLILASLGFNSGHISSEVLSLITMVGLITIAGSTYFILYADKIYPYVDRYLKMLEFIKKKKTEINIDQEVFDVLLFGFDRVGYDFVQTFKQLSVSHVVIDFNPESIKRMSTLDVPYRFGDAEDVEFLGEMNFKKAKMVVSTMPDFRTNMLLTRYVKKLNSRIVIIMLSHTIKQAESLYREGASYVIMPHYLGARYAARMIKKYGLDKKEYKKEQELHLKYISQKINRPEYSYPRI